MVNITLTEKEKKLILEFIKVELDSYRIGGGKVKKKEFDFDCDFSDDMHNKDLMKSIYYKLNTNKTNRKK